MYNLQLSGFSFYVKLFLRCYRILEIERLLNEMEIVMCFNKIAISKVYF